VPNIPDKTNRIERHCFSPMLYRQRNRVERLFNKIKYFRRVTTRFEDRASNHHAVLKLAAIRIWLRASETMA
jgi:transposase